jgi:hypothetical protein
MSILNANKIIIVGDIHSNFIKFFEPLKQANIIQSYCITDNYIHYSFTESEPTSEVIYLGDFIHRGNQNQMFILNALVDICSKYPNNVKFVLGNHDIAECDYFLKHVNSDLFQFSTLVDHNICERCPKYGEIMKKFIDFLKTKDNLLKLEYFDFIISHTIHFKLIPASLRSCISSSMKYSKCYSMIRPKTPRYKLPPYFNNKQEYLNIVNKYRKVNLDNYDDYYSEIEKYITKEYPNYVNHIEEGNEHTDELFDKFIHKELNVDYYYEIFKYDLFGNRTESSLTTSIDIKYPKLQIIGHDKQDEINYDNKNNIIWCDSINNSWLIYSRNKIDDEKYMKLKGLDNFYIYKMEF